MDIRPVKTEADHEAALKEIEELMDAEEGTPRSDRLHVLATLVSAYENEHFPIDLPDPVEAIKFRMEQAGLARQKLEPLLGGANRVTEILNRTRALSIGMIRRLHAELGIPLESLIREYRTASPRRRHRRSAQRGRTRSAA
jgi:HTH-type transcriptional regulator/antitoxin HigA